MADGLFDTVMANGFEMLDGFETKVIELGACLWTDGIKVGKGSAVSPPLNGEKYEKVL